MTQPAIIQGGMGVAVTGWRLARADGLDELPLVTAGDDLTHLAEFSTAWPRLLLRRRRPPPASPPTGL
jgi:hypothetical protein